MRRVPRIVHIAEKADQRTAAISELMQIVLAQNHRAGLPQPPHHFRIFGRHTILIKRAGSGRARARRIDQILQRNRNPVQRPAPLPARDFISAARASASADSAITVMKAFSDGFSFSMRSRQSRVSSTGETSFRRSRGASSTIVSRHRHWWTHCSGPLVRYPLSLCAACVNVFHSKKKATIAEGL